MATENVREIALECLLLIDKEGQKSHLVLGDVLSRYQYMDKQDRAFLTRLVEGTLERRIELDYIIDQFSKTPVKKQKPVVKNILRMGVYQLKYMDRVPSHAVCNESVKLAQRKGFYQLKGFVNGVLRNISRNLDQVKMPENADAKYISVKYSLPEWLASMWISDYGFERTEEIAKNFFLPSKTTIRTNTVKVSPDELKARLISEGVTVEEVESLPYAFRISGYDYLGSLESFEEGLFSVQDMSSMQVAEWADVKENQKILDVCAAPGGKAIHLAEKLKNTGLVEARDLTEYKVSLIEENIERCQLSNIRASQWDARVLDEAAKGAYDIVLADLPCSGLGVLGKKPDLKYNMTPKTMEELVALQREILNVVCQYVKKGGTLLYSTCTIHKGENEGNVAWFLEEHPEFSLVKEEQIFPGTSGNDGFFISEFCRHDDENKA